MKNSPDVPEDLLSLVRRWSRRGWKTPIKRTFNEISQILKRKQKKKIIEMKYKKTFSLTIQQTNG